MGLKIIREQKEKVKKYEYEKQEREQKQREEVAIRKRNDEAFNKAIEEQDKKKLYDKIINYRDELKNYIEYI
jgi:CHASE3 domain sensor protein